LSEPLTYWDYVRAAFKRRWPVPGMGHLPLHQLALAGFAVLGIANPGFWLLGGAAEVGYLAWLSGSRRFQNLVRAERLARVQESWEAKIERAVDRLDPRSRERYRELLGECRKILGLSGEVDTDSLGSFRDLRANSLNQLLSIYLRLLTSREILRRNLEHLDRKKLESEIQSLTDRLDHLDTDADAALRRSLEGTLEIQRRRLDNLERSISSREVMEAELQRIERQVELLREEAAVSGSPEALSTRLDAVTSTMSETTRWMDQHADLFQELSTDSETAALADLPHLPEAEETESLPPLPERASEGESA
jgi:hypothetical protein